MIRSIHAQEMRWPTASKRPVWAWMMSILLHLSLLTTIGLYAGRPSRDSGTEVEPDRPVSVALVHRLADRSEPQSDPPVAASPSQTPATDESDHRAEGVAASSASVPPDFAPPIDLAGALAEMTAAVDPAGTAAEVSGELGGPGFWDEPGAGATGPGDRGLKAATEGSQGSTSLFGVSASGSRFVYVVDRSDSMNSFGGRPWRAAKAELNRSLEMLTESQFFQLVLYNDQPRPYRGAVVSGGPVQMLQGQRDLIARAQRYVTSAEAFGGTQHADALRMALRMGPDVIFFLTDGHIPSLSERELSDIRRLAGRSATTIHAIEFGTEPSPDPSTFVRQLAGQNRGEYRYFDISRFSDSGTWEHAEP